MYCLEIGPGKCNKRNNRDVWLNSYLKSWFWQAVKKAIKAAQALISAAGSSSSFCSLQRCDSGATSSRACGFMHLQFPRLP